MIFSEEDFSQSQSVKGFSFDGDESLDDGSEDEGASIITSDPFSDPVTPDHHIPGKSYFIHRMVIGND